MTERITHAPDGIRTLQPSNSGAVHRPGRHETLTPQYTKHMEPNTAAPVAHLVKRHTRYPKVVGYPKRQ